MKRFGVYELDERSGELRKHGVRVKLQEQPFRILALMAARPGEPVTREELRRLLWPADTFVDFDNSLNAAMNKVREALCDSPSNPRFVETIPRRGYRFVAPVHCVEEAAEKLADSQGVVQRELPAASRTPVAKAPGSWTGIQSYHLWLAALAVLLAILGGYALLAPRFSAARAPVASGPSGRAMLAVLPFQNLTNDAAQDYFIAGLSEEMITKLGTLQPARLGVIARASVVQYKDRLKPIQEIGRELNVQYVLEGSVRAMGSRVRISMQLSQVSDQTQLWAQSYERELADVFAIQSDVARQVANSLALKLLPNEREALERAATNSVYAYEEYLRGRYFWNQRTEDGLTRCRGHLENAVGADPQYALAYAGLADCYNLNGGYAVLEPKDAFPRAKQAARKAIELDGSLAQGHAALGFALLYHDWSWNEAEFEFKRAIELNANYVLARISYAQLLRAQNRLDEAEAQLRLAHDVDPMDRVAQNYRGWMEFTRRRYANATEIFRVTVNNYPNWPSAYISLGYGLAQERKFEEAAAALQKARLYSTDAPSALEAYGYVVALSGNRQEARRILSQLSTIARTRRVSSYDVAMIHAALGDADSAFVWLNRAFAQRDPWMIWLGVHPEWDPLREDRRFKELLERMRL